MTSASRNNIKFNYLYRDGGNFKVFGCEIFSNPGTLEISYIERKIVEALTDYHYFNPLKWKVKQLKHDDWIPELDHPWNEFESLELTKDEPTVNISISEFLDLIKIKG